MEDQKKIIKKIGIFWRWWGNNTSMQEAAAAALKAQELIAKYHIEYADIRDGSGVQEILKTAHTQQRFSGFYMRLGTGFTAVTTRSVGGRTGRRKE